MGLQSWLHTGVADREEVARAQVREGQESLEVLLVEEHEVGGQRELRTLGRGETPGYLLPEDRVPDRAASHAHLVVATVRTDQPVSLVSAFEQPIRQDSAAGYLGRSVERLAKHAQQIETAFGLRPVHAFVAGLADEAVTAPLGQAVTFTELPGQVNEAVSALIAGQEQDL